MKIYRSSRCGGLTRGGIGKVLVLAQLFIVACLSIDQSWADQSDFYIYTVHNSYQAVFPRQPTFSGELGNDEITVRAYQYHDHGSLLGYSTNATLEKMRFRKRDIETALRNWVLGDVQSVNGHLETSLIGSVNGHPGATYRYSYLLHGEIEMRKCSAVIFHDGRFVTWAVQGSVALSAIDPCVIFERYRTYFGPRTSK